MEHTPATAPAYCLRLHAAYRCQHAGACCTAGWAIPMEEPALARVQKKFAGRAHTLFLSDHVGQSVGQPAILARTPGGDCVFFERDGGNLCVIHRDLGPESLPVACQHFPRVVLQRPRDTRISLSHFCPTAAKLLRSPGADAFEIVAAPASLALDGRAEGLDARDTLPPLLRPGMLMDEDGYSAWERRCLEILGRGDRTADQAVAVIAAATGALQSWRPGGVTLSATVDREFDVGTTSNQMKIWSDSSRALAWQYVRCHKGSRSHHRSRTSAKHGAASAHGGETSTARYAHTWQRASLETGSHTTGRACTQSSTICASPLR